MSKIIRLLKDNRSGAIIEQTYQMETIFSKYSEKDFLRIGIFLNYVLHSHGDDNMSLTITGPNSQNALDIFSHKARNWIQTAKGGNLDMKYFGATSTKPNNIHSSEQNILGLNDFDGDAELTLSVKDTNFGVNVNKLTENGFAALYMLGKYRKNVGYITKNLSYLADIEDSVIDLEEIFQKLSMEFNKIEIEKRNKKRYEEWRNDIINDTVNVMHYKKTNRDFIAFLLLHMFNECFDEFDIYEFEAISDGRLKVRSLDKYMKELRRKMKRELIKEVKKEVKS